MGRQVKTFQHPAATQPLIDAVLSDRPGRADGIHGLSHWLRVERNALFLATREGGDLVVASLFALFHDARRENDGYDPGHGVRGAEFANSLFVDGLLKITHQQLALLLFACENHTDQIHCDNLTIGCCWDADRLDLPRVSIMPESRFLNTDTAKRLANTGELGVLNGFTIPPATAANGDQPIRQP